jgi:flavin-dependent dehydrogenase
VILGGGSAGWLTASLLAAEHGQAVGGGLRITLIESPETAPIGVGEGTWPSMRDTLRRIGVTETGLVRGCDASFKQGSRFDGWVRGGVDDSYFHPFGLPQGYTEADLVAGWLQGHAQAPFAELVCPQPLLCRQGRAPKQFTTPEYAAVANYAYHFDAGKFGQFLRRHAVESLGVQHVSDHMIGVDAHENGDIAALRTRNHGAVSGDLFVDCTGLPSLLLGEHCGVPLVSQRPVLFNDAALAVQVPYPSADTPLASQTISTAHGAGWIWDIGLPTRRGVGCVYSTAHVSDAEAERTLREYITRTGGGDTLPTPRRLSFEPGFRERFWHRNCVAIGLSQGFIEPLEASALALVEMSAATLCDQMPATREAMDIVGRRFNEAFGYRWSRVIEFLKLHYVLSQRTDTDYWQDHRRVDTVPERLREQLLLWRHRPPSRHDLWRVEEMFPSASYQYVLYGMGFRPEQAHGTRRPEAPAMAEGFFREADTLSRRMLAGLPGHRELVEHIHRHGQQRI